MFFKKKNEVQSLHLADQGASSCYVEAYKSLGITVDAAAAESGCKCILIASAEPKDGRTTVALNLARALSYQGKDTILIDADMRQKRLSAYFQQSIKHSGLSEVLLEKAILEDSIVKMPEQNFDLLPAGMHNCKSSVLLDEAKMSRILQELRENYSYIILDSPPTASATDAVSLSRVTDGVLLVARNNGTNTQVFLECNRKLRIVKANILGTVLTDYDEIRLPPKT